MKCDEYLNSLTSDTELLVSTEKQFEKLAIYFCRKRYLCAKKYVVFPRSMCFSKIYLL